MLRKGIITVTLVSVTVMFFIELKKEYFFQVAFLNVGQGDSILINFESGEKMLVDCGPDRAILNQLSAAMKSFDRTIDYLLVTHFDLDHYGGCIDVLERYDIKHIITNGSKKNYDKYWLAWSEAAQKEGVIIQEITTFHKQIIGNVIFTFLAPDRELLDTSKLSSNNTSIVFRFTGPNKKTYLFTGDIESEVEEALVRKYCHSYPSKTVTSCPLLKADVLKVAHHGSDTSTAEEFLKAVQPTKAIISLAKKNSFGHPSERVIRRLKRLGVEILRTDILNVILNP